MEKRIAVTLKELGIPANLEGYRYLITAITKLINGFNIHRRYCTLYRTVADEHDTTYTRVERAMRHAIEVGCLRGNYDFWKDMFRYSIGSAQGKPTNAEFLATVAEYIRLNYVPAEVKSDEDR